MCINIIKKELSQVFKGWVARCLMILSSVLAFDKYTLYLLYPETKQSYIYKWQLQGLWRTIYYISLLVDAT